MPSPSSSPRILLATANGLSLLGLRHLLARVPGADIVAEVSCQRRLSQALHQHRPTLLIVDSRMVAKAGDHFDLSRTRVLLLSSRAHAGALPADLFVCGFISDRDDLEKIGSVLDTATGCAGPNVERVCAHCPLTTAFTPVQALPLTLRESQIFTLLGKGLGTSDIAQALTRSVKTIETHRENIKRKIGLGNAIELVDAARCWVRGERIEIASDSPAVSPPGARGKARRKAQARNSSH